MTIFSGRFELSTVTISYVNIISSIFA